MKLRDPQTVIEQVALLFASLVWTTIVLLGIAFFWAYRDVQTRWEFVLSAPPPEALAQVAPTPIPSPTITPWPSTATPVATLLPTPLPTLVVPPPEILPETLNADEPTPIPVIVHTEDEATEFGFELGQAASDQTESITTALMPTPTPVPVQAAVPPEQNAGPVTATTSQVSNKPSRLVIPSVGIDSDIIPVGWNVIEKNGFQYSIWQVADYAVGWHNTTALLGQTGNTVMAGHHNVNGEVFRDLVNVEVGDKVIAYAGDQLFEYEIELKTIVKEKGESADVRRRNAEWIAPTDDERLTFVTCWPYTNNTHRVIVVAKPTT